MNRGVKQMGNNKTRNSKVRYAVVGLGHLAQVAVLPAFRSTRNSELVAIVSSDAEKREKLKKKYKLKRAYSNDEYQQALSDVDAVYLVVPNHLHREYAVKAARAGVHVLCEKPMAVTEEDCHSMIDAAEESGVRLMIAYRLHFEKGNLQAIRTAESGQIGEPRIFASEFAQQVAEDNVRVTEPVEKGGGPVYDMGVYCINAARYLFRSEPTSIFAASASNGERRFRNVEEMTSVTMRFPGDRLGTFTCSFGAADIGRYTLVGTKGVLTADPGYEYATGLRHQLVIGENTKKKTFPKRDQFAAEISYFSDCVLNGKQPEPSGREGLADIRVVRAIYESAGTGKVVELGNFAVSDRPSMKQEIHRPPHGKPQTVKAKGPSEEAA